MKIKTAEQYNKLQAGRNCLAGTSNKKAAGSRRNKKHHFTTHNNGNRKSMARTAMLELDRALGSAVLDLAWGSKPNYQSRAVSMSDCFPDPVGVTNE